MVIPSQAKSLSESRTQEKVGSRPTSEVIIQGCDRRRYYVIYVNVLKIDVIYVIFDFEDVIRYFCQNETLFLSN